MQKSIKLVISTSFNKKSAG